MHFTDTSQPTKESRLVLGPIYALGFEEEGDLGLVSTYAQRPNKSRRTRAKLTSVSQRRSVLHAGKILSSAKLEKGVSMCWEIRTNFFSLLSLSFFCLSAARFHSTKSKFQVPPIIHSDAVAGTVCAIKEGVFGQ